MIMGIRRLLAGAALIGMAAIGAAVPAYADDPDPDLPSGPNDPRCIGLPGYAMCQGGPFAQPAAPSAPTSPSDPVCATMPGDGACAGGPYAIPMPDPSMPGHI